MSIVCTVIIADLVCVAAFELVKAHYDSGLEIGIMFFGLPLMIILSFGTLDKRKEFETKQFKPYNVLDIAFKFLVFIIVQVYRRQQVDAIYYLALGVIGLLIIACLYLEMLMLAIIKKRFSVDSVDVDKTINNVDQDTVNKATQLSMLRIACIVLLDIVIFLTLAVVVFLLHKIDYVWIVLGLALLVVIANWFLYTNKVPIMDSKYKLIILLIIIKLVLVGIVCVCMYLLLDTLISAIIASVLGVMVITINQFIIKLINVADKKQVNDSIK